MSAAATTRAVARALSLAVPVALVIGPLAGEALAVRPPKATPPQVQVTPDPGKVLTPSQVTNSPRLTFGWTSTSGQTYACVLDGVAVSCNGGNVIADESSKADGPHSFSMRVKQPSYRQATWTYSWSVRTAAPTQPTITYAPTGSTSATSAIVQWSDTDTKAASYTCELRKDGAVVVAPFTCAGSGTSHSYTFTGLSDDVTSPASYVANVWAIDQFGSPIDLSSVSPGSAQWYVDSHKPLTPTFTQVPSNPSNSSTAAFAWTASDNSGSIASYVCLLDGARVTPCDASGSSYHVADGDHSFAVYAVDAAGNPSPTTPAYGWTVMTGKPPVPAVETGPAQPTTDVSDATFYFSNGRDAATDGTSYLCSLDTAAYVACSSPQSYSGLADGDHTFTVEAVDAAGNVSDPSAPWAWKIDTSTNSPVLVSAPKIQSGPAAFSSDTNPSLSWVDLDPTAVSDECSLDGGTTWNPCSSPSTLSLSGDGAKQFQVRSIDGSANRSPASTWSWTLDTVAPSTPAFTSAPANPTTSTTASFGFGSDPDAQLRCQLDNGPLAVCGSPATFQNLATGTHTFVVTATDRAGNASQSTYTWTIQPPAPPAAGGTTPATSPSGGTAPGDTTAPTVSSISTPSTLTAPATATFSETVKGLDAAAVRLSVTGASAALPVATTCLSGTTVVACSGQFTAVRLSPKAALLPGQHYTVTVGAGATHDVAGNPSAAATASFRAARTVTESNAVVQHAWQKVSTKSAFGSSYVQEHLAGATASWTFTGTNVTWWTVTGPTMGKAQLLVDGTSKGTFSNYSSKAKFHVARTVKGLRNGKHTVTVKVLGVKGAKIAKGTFVAVDAFTVGKTRTATPTLVTTLRSIASKSFLGGHATVADLKGVTVTLAFRGTGIVWTTMKSVTQGKAAVYIDGKLKATYDDYAAKTAYKVTRSISKLFDKVHTLRIVVLGTHHKGGKGNLVTVDQFKVV